MRQRVKFWLNEWKCWFYFHHHMESLGKYGTNQHLYQCTFCFKRIVVNPFGAQKGVVGLIKPQAGHSILIDKKTGQVIPEEAYMRRSAVGAKQVNK